MGHDGFEKCCRLLLSVKPDILMAAHWGPLPMTEAYLKKFLAYLEARAAIYRKLFPYDDVNFGLDPYWIRAYPFRQRAAPGAQVEIEARVLNHAEKPKKVRVTLKLQEGWKPIRTTAEGTIPARTESSLRLAATAPADMSRRQVLGIAAEVDGRPLGEFADAIVDLLIA
jgi:hypothetical protein